MVPSKLKYIYKNKIFNIFLKTSFDVAFYKNVIIFTFKHYFIKYNLTVMFKKYLFIL